MFSEAIETATTDKVIAAPDPDHGVGYSSTSKHKDDAIVHAHRHVQPMPRQFNWISALGLGFSITNSWVGYLSCFGQNLAYGGAQACIFSLVAAFMVQVIVTLGLAELASAFPSSGGQYHFCYILSPDRTKRYSAFVVGWLSILAWWVVTCSGLSLVAVCINGIANFYHPVYTASQWQTYLMYLGASVVTSRLNQDSILHQALIHPTVMPVFAAPKRISLVTQCALYLTLAGYLVFFVVMLSMHQQVQPGSFILSSAQGNSGWSRGTAWILAINNSMYAYGSTDAVIHICEELPQPGRRVPQVMIMTLAIGAVTSISLFVALMFFVDDIDAVRDASLPSLELVYQITGNRRITLGLSIILAIIYAASLPSQWVTCGRIAWAFSRDNGLPFPEYFSQISKTFNFPVHTTIAAFLFTSLYGLLYLASTTAFNSIITSAVLFLNITYTVPQGILLSSGRSSMPKRYLNLGWAGYFCNGFAVVWIVIQGVLTCLPPDPEVTLGSMNYVCVILVGVFLVINLLWVAVGRKRFSGPDIDWGVVKTGQRE
ncbi:choline transporter [Aspergillus niger]|nr:choline transporter [Aspergillus niger]